MAATVAAHAGVGSLAARAASTRARCRPSGRAVWANGARDGAPRTEATGRARGDAERECRRERHEVETPSTSSVGGRAFGALATAVIASAGAGAGEHIAALTGATVVKAFNTFGAEPLRAGHIEGRPIDAMLAGDDADALAMVGELCAEMGLRPIEVGPLRQARATEHVAMLWIHLAKFKGHGRNISFSLLEGPLTV